MIVGDERLELRRHKPADLKFVTALLRMCYPEEEWTLPDLKAFLAKEGTRNELRVVSDSTNQVYMVMLYTLEQNRCRLRRLGVAAGFRRTGIARFAVNALVGKRSPLGSTVVVARVCEDNVPAVRLLSGLGFAAILQRNKDKRQRDHYLFTLVRTPSEARQLALQS